MKFDRDGVDKNIMSTAPKLAVAGVKPEKPTSPTLEQLKAEAYDLLANIEQFQIGLQQLNQQLQAKNAEITAKMQELAVPIEPEILDLTDQ